ncbi:hypothetical protein OSB04_021404 [Centaurea solstitialis]|uniref:Transposase, Ptta/En/Spm, plant n=1 Tax=Centaurea solstitialis TaxID=347529 RepID=A0AA38T5G9_9ASTR|nr:hypothetical protein OSB04_021404 [Centaurea solstitialis]
MLQFFSRFLKISSTFRYADRRKIAYVTFRDPKALEIALLLSDDMLKSQGGSSSSCPSRGGSNSVRGKGGSSSSRLSRESGRSLGGSSTISGDLRSEDVHDVEDIFVESHASGVGGRGDNIEPETPAHPSQRRMIGLLETDPMEFSDVCVASGIIGTLKNTFNGPWTTWRMVPREARDKMWDRFQSQYQWDPAIHGMIQLAWENVFKKRFSNVIDLARDAAKKAASNGTPPFTGTNYDVLKPYNPSWIRQEDWIRMVEVWDTPRWKARSKSGKRNRNTKHEGSISKHTHGSISTARHRHRMQLRKKRPVSLVELFRKTHTKKGSEELITPKATQTLSRYQQSLVEKYGEDVDAQPQSGDVDLWTQAVGGVKKGRIFGFGAPRDPHHVMTGIPSSSSQSYGQGTIDEVRRLKEELKQRDEQLAEQQRTFEQRCEERIQQQIAEQVTAQMKVLMEQVARLTGAPVSFTIPPPAPTSL